MCIFKYQNDVIKNSFNIKRIMILTSNIKLLKSFLERMGP